jgi:hypothetical protein
LPFTLPATTAFLLARADKLAKEIERDRRKEEKAELIRRGVYRAE